METFNYGTGKPLREWKVYSIKGIYIENIVTDDIDLRAEELNQQIAATEVNPKNKNEKNLHH